MICVVWTLLKIFCLEDMACFACRDDQQLDSLSMRITPIIHDMTRNGIVCTESILGLVLACAAQCH